jgi:hypothetical protein
VRKVLKNDDSHHGVKPGQVDDDQGGKNERAPSCRVAKLATENAINGKLQKQIGGLDNKLADKNSGTARHVLLLNGSYTPWFFQFTKHFYFRQKILLVSLNFSFDLIRKIFILLRLALTRELRQFEFTLSSLQQLVRTASLRRL